VPVDPGTDSRHAVRETGLAFNDAINRRDLVALGGLMTDDHTFIDTEDNVVSGREDVLGAWRGFFGAFPDYRNVWANLTVKGETLVAVGHSTCASEPELDGPAIWTARVRADGVSLWRVCTDTPENRIQLALDPARCQPSRRQAE
jgi:ketosteroid isomerase-like protein